MNENETNAPGTSALEDALPGLEEELAGWERQLDEIQARVERRRALVRAIRDELGPGGDAASSVLQDRSVHSNHDRLTARQVVLAVLADLDRLVATREVIERAQAIGLRPSVENPENAMSASLSYLAKRGHVMKEVDGTRVKWRLAESGRELASRSSIRVRA